MFLTASSADRVAAARTARGETLRERLETMGLRYPCPEIFLRAFKHERELEVWARNDSDSYRLVAAFPLTASSGVAGPKRREGDRQVPEGCYHVAVFNPKSLFHLSLGLNYPNAADRVHADAEKPGGEIYIHGGAKSVGCLAIGNAAIEEVYLLALGARESGQTVIPVHIFPARMAGPQWPEFVRQHPEQQAFWAQLAPIYEAFESARQVPAVTITADGRYGIAEPKKGPR